MAVLSREEYLTKIQERLGDDVSDDSIKFLEDLTDTYNDLEKRAKGDGEDWKKRYEDNNEAWKKRYQQRFFSGGGYSNNPDGFGEDSDPEDEALKRASSISINDLFGGK